MNILKKVLLITLIILNLTYIPSMAMSFDEKMVIEAQMTLDNLENIHIPSRLESFDNSRAGVTQDVLNFTGSWRSKLYSVKRTSGSSGITISAINYGDNLVDVALFKKGEPVLIGTTKSIYPGQQALLSWANSEIVGNPSEVDIHFSMYKTATNYMTTVITY